MYMLIDLTVNGPIIHYHFTPHFNRDAENNRREKIKTMAFSSLFLVNLRNSFLSIKSQSSKLPGLRPGLSSLFQTSPATGCFSGDSWDEAQHCVTEQISRGFWWMVGLQILPNLVHLGLGPQIGISGKVSNDAQSTAWKPQFGHSIDELTSLWISINCLSLSLSYYDDILPQVSR